MLPPADRGSDPGQKRVQRPDDRIAHHRQRTDPVAQLLAELSGKQIKERSLRVDMDPGTDFGGCHVLFIGRSERRWHDILGRLRGNVLTISDADGFASAGGIVGFFSDSGRIKLDINPDAARQANLKISAKLLELARTVQ